MNNLGHKPTSSFLNMKILSPSQKYSVKEIATELGYSAKLANGIRSNFGDPISINELKLITRRDFLSCKNLGWISLRQFKEGLSVYCILDSAVTLINKPNMDTVIVEIDTTKPFKEVIQGLAKIFHGKI